MMHKKILLTIATARAYRKRRETLRKTWLRDIREKNLNVEYVFFYGKPDGDTPMEAEDDLVEVDCSDKYEYLPDKHWRIFRYALENKEFDYIFDCDDDTFVDLARLCRLVDDEEDVGLRGEVISAGYDNRMTISGGAGLLISRKRVKEIVEAHLPVRGCDDLLIYDYCRERGLDYCDDKRFSHDKFRFPLESNNVITSHWLKMPEMEMIYRVYDREALVTSGDISCYVREGHAYAVRKRNENRYLLGEIERKGERLFFIKWNDKFVSSRIEDESVIDALSRLNLNFQAEPFLPEHPRVAIICCSYNRFEHLVRQLYWALMQNYENCRVFFAVKGLDEYQFNVYLLNEFKPFIDSGKLVLRLFPNKNQLSNMIDPIRDVDLDEFDLFVKIDDDDFYSLSYVGDCVKLHEKYPADYSSVVYRRNSLTKTDYGGLVTGSHNSNVIGNVSIFSKTVMKELADCEKDSEKLSELAQEYGLDSGVKFGQNEDQVLDMLMQRHGLFDRNESSFDNFHLLINASTISMMRSSEHKTYLSERFKLCNYTISDDEACWEYVVRMKHPIWERSYILFGGNGYLLDEPETRHFHVLYFDNEFLVVKWLSYGVEAFGKDESGKFVFLECNGREPEEIPKEVSLRIGNFLFKCQRRGNRLFCDNFVKPFVIKRDGGALLTCVMDAREYLLLNIRDTMYVHVQDPPPSSSV